MKTALRSFWAQLRRDIWRLGDQVRRQGLRLTLQAGHDKLLRLLQRSPLRRYTQISPHIILGGQPAQRVIAKLKAQRGVTGVINMRQEYDYVQQVEANAVRYLYLPTPDHEAPSIENLLKGVDFIRDEVAAGGAVYIHCWEGIGRGPTMAAAYFVSTGMNPADALTHIRRIRPFIEPTPIQLTRLEEFAAIYGQPGTVTDEPPTAENVDAPAPDA